MGQRMMMLSDKDPRSIRFRRIKKAITQVFLTGERIKSQASTATSTAPKKLRRPVDDV